MATAMEARPLDPRTLLRIHEPRTLGALRALVDGLLAQIMPAASVAVLVDDGTGPGCAVELARGRACPLHVGSRVARDAWQSEGLQRIAMSFAGMPIGEMLVLDVGGPEPRPWLGSFVDHYAAALAKLELDIAAHAAVDDYCAGLQAFQEGVVLFQEKDRDVTTARFLQLASSLLQAPHGALLTYARVGDADSALRLDQVLGVPETLITAMLDQQEGKWPRSQVDDGPRVHMRGEPAFPRLPQDGPGALVDNVVTCPLTYHGITAGVAVFFNVDAEDGRLALKMSTLRSLGELGAALLHRIQLEQEAVFAKGLETQIAVAAAIQARLLPERAPNNPRWSYAWSSQPSQSIGGDYLDLFDGDGDTVLAIVADVSGHGINSALLAASTRAHYRALASHSAPGDVLARLNDELHREVGATGMFVTAVAMSLAANARAVRMSSAGHNPVLLLRAARRSVTWIDANGPPLGFVSGADYSNTDLELAPGDILLLYSDGITEATDANDDMFGEERLAQHLVAMADQDPRAILDDLLAAVDAFVGGSNRADDVSVAVFKVAS